MNVRLRVLSGSRSGELILISERRVLVGRGEDCQLGTDSEFVSRHHCVLLLEDDALRIQDLGSKNGTFVNGRRIGSEARILTHEDLIGVGDLAWQVDLTQADGSRVETVAQSDQALPPQALLGTSVYAGDTIDPCVTSPTESSASRSSAKHASSERKPAEKTRKSTGR